MHDDFGNRAVSSEIVQVKDILPDTGGLHLLLCVCTVLCLVITYVREV